MSLHLFLSRVCLIAATAALTLSSSSLASEHRGHQFIGFTNLSTFEGTSRPRETIYLSPQIQSEFAFNELIASWNAEFPPTAWLQLEARAFTGADPTKFYTLALWSTAPVSHPRQSINDQKDSAGDVSTDTLLLNQPANSFQLRLTIGSETTNRPPLKFLGICLTDTKAKLPELPPNKSAWGKTVPVPERSQGAYPNGGVLCSPTTVSMIMTYWSKDQKRPELDHDVPEVAKAVYDTTWKGTGNWPFNTAYAGSFPRMRAYVSRMSDVSELEDWLAAGLPVGMSVDYDRLRGKGPGPNGHLVVCVGFTETGDPIINDPGTLKHVHKTFSREALIYAWAYSHNTVYLIYPESARLPEDRFHHWFR